MFTELKQTFTKLNQAFIELNQTFTELPRPPPLYGHVRNYKFFYAFPYLVYVVDTPVDLTKETF